MNYNRLIDIKFLSSQIMTDIIVIRHLCLQALGLANILILVSRLLCLQTLIEISVPLFRNTSRHYIN